MTTLPVILMSHSFQTVNCTAIWNGHSPAVDWIEPVRIYFLKNASLYDEQDADGLAYSFVLILLPKKVLLIK